MTSCVQNRNVFPHKLRKEDKDIIFDGLEGIISDVFIEKIWAMTFERYKIYETIRNKRR